MWKFQFIISLCALQVMGFPIDNFDEHKNIGFVINKSRNEILKPDNFDTKSPYSLYNTDFEDLNNRDKRENIYMDNEDPIYPPPTKPTTKATTTTISTTKKPTSTTKYPVTTTDYPKTTTKPTTTKLPSTRLPNCDHTTHHTHTCPYCTPPTTTHTCKWCNTPPFCCATEKENDKDIWDIAYDIHDYIMDVFCW